MALLADLGMVEALLSNIVVRKFAMASLACTKNGWSRLMVFAVRFFVSYATWRPTNALQRHYLGEAPHHGLADFVDSAAIA
eukprot:3169273-Amphidinium_carterae.1